MENNINPGEETTPTKTQAPNEMQSVIRTSAITALITTIIVTAAFVNISKNHPDILGGLGNITNQGQTVHTISQSENAVVDAVKKANPAVVAITISKNVPTYEQYMQNIPGVFGNMQIPQVRQNGTKLQEVGGGSGFLVSADGYIVTNKHVVADETAQYTVLTNDGKKYDAKVVGRDPILDLAVIKIDGSNFPSLNFGDSDQVQVGQTTIAIGNALGEFRNTVSTGIVSGLARSITASDHAGGSENLDQLIQTDASINPGNSGGPLLNLSGEVIGVNVAVANDANGIGFALSANSVKNVVDSVKKTGKIVRPYLGVRYTPVTPELQKANNLSVDYGVLVSQGATPTELAVLPGSPADKAGIQANDIILEVDGKKLDDTYSLSNAVGSKNVGDRITLKILSKGTEKTITVTLEELKQ
ncbi:MAG TPA: trypsin-like peptidase domain-containing protein [Patescibacteria group bacterium]|jgi:S1-C subfamily serine protease|nr:trypsin-like peptidase domain-containing protein [Patescibacteria group bacterium]